MALMGHFGFTWSCPSGSHGKFFNADLNLEIKPATRPHGGSNTIPRYQIVQYKRQLYMLGFIDTEE